MSWDKSRPSYVSLFGGGGIAPPAKFNFLLIDFIQIIVSLPEFYGSNDRKIGMKRSRKELLKRIGKITQTRYSQKEIKCMTNRKKKYLLGPIQLSERTSEILQLLLNELHQTKSSIVISEMKERFGEIGECFSRCLLGGYIPLILANAENVPKNHREYPYFQRIIEGINSIDQDSKSLPLGTIIDEISQKTLSPSKI